MNANETQVAGDHYKRRGRPPIQDPEIGYRVCTHCGKSIPLSELVSRVINEEIKYARRCKPCNRKISQIAYWQSPEAARQRTAEWRVQNIEKKKAYQKEYLSKNRDAANKYAKKNCLALTDSYVRSKLVTTYNGRRTITASAIPDELVALKRLQILIKRQLKENAT